MTASQPSPAPSNQTEQPLVGISNVFRPNTINTSDSVVPFISGFSGASSNYASQFILTSTYNISDSQGVVESVYTLPFSVEMEAPLISVLTEHEFEL